MDTRKAEAGRKILAEQFLDAIDLNDAEMDAINGTGGGDRRFDDFDRDDNNTNINIINLTSISCWGGGCWGGGFGGWGGGFGGRGWGGRGWR